MRKKFHICVVSLLFDAKPEGICTGRLVRALLDAGHHITLLTSSKAKHALRHKNLTVHVYSVNPKEPRSIFNAWALARGEIANNYYFWSKRVAKHQWPNNNQPDLIYGRGWPHASLAAAYQLATKTDLPLALHFSDPFPAPNEPPLKKHFMNDLNKMVARAKMVTFTNEETINYQQQHLSIAAGKMAAIPHVALPQQSFLHAAPANIFYYIGSVGKTRPVDMLLRGFKIFLQQAPIAKLYFVGSSKKYLAPIISSLGIEASVEVLPFTDDVSQSMAQASTLISVDVTVEHPIFTPTKILEYLSVNRKILALSNDNSPVTKLLSDFSNSTVVCTQHSADNIASSFSQVSQLNPSNHDFIARTHMMKKFQPAEIAEQFSQLVLQSIS